MDMLHQRFSDFAGVTEVCEIYPRTEKFKRHYLNKMLSAKTDGLD